MRAYGEEYLPRAMKNLGEAVDYAVNAGGIDADLFLERFILSGLAAEWACGSPRVLVGMSGTELVRESFRLTGSSRNWPLPRRDFDLSPEYWGGWILAYYQWHSGRDFRSIARGLPLAEIIGKYHPFHEASESRFVDWAEERVREMKSGPELKELRHRRGWTQQELSLRSGVSLRSIRNYEQHPESIEKGEFAAITSLEHALCP